jgi:hypothetical protein
MAVHNQVGAFVPTTNIWDVGEIYQVNVNSNEFKELLVRLYQNINNISILLNIKDTGYYPLQEFVTSKLLFPNPLLDSQTATVPVFRPIYRMTVNFGALPNTGTKSVPHGITCTNVTTFTMSYAEASDTTGHNYIQISYASPVLANNIELKVDGTNVTIITGSNRSNFNVCYVFLEYVQS